MVNCGYKKKNKPWAGEDLMPMTGPQSPILFQIGQVPKGWVIRPIKVQGKTPEKKGLLGENSKNIRFGGGCHRYNHSKEKKKHKKKRIMGKAIRVYDGTTKTTIREKKIHRPIWNGGKTL